MLRYDSKQWLNLITITFVACIIEQDMDLPWRRNCHTAFWSFKLLESGKGEIPKSDRAEIGAVLNLIQRGVAVWPIHCARSLRDGSSRPKNPCADKPASSNIRLLCSASGPLFCLVLRDEPVHLFLDFSSAPHHTGWLQIAACCVRMVVKSDLASSSIILPGSARHRSNRILS